MKVIPSALQKNLSTTAVAQVDAGKHSWVLSFGWMKPDIKQKLRVQDPNPGLERHSGMCPEVVSESAAHSWRRFSSCRGSLTGVTSRYAATFDTARL